MSFTAINSVAGGAKKDTGRGAGKGARDSDKMTAKDQGKELPAENEEEKDEEKDAYIKSLTGTYDTLDSELTLSLKKSTSYLLLRHMVIRKFIKPYEPDEKGKQFQTFCCHCDKAWGPYDMHNTTTSYLIRHFSIDHPDLPKTYPEEDALLRRMKKGFVEDPEESKDKDSKDKNVKDAKAKGKRRGGKNKADGLKEAKAGEAGAKGGGREQEGKHGQASTRKLEKNKRGRAIAEPETPVQLKAAGVNAVSTKSRSDEALASLRKTRSGKRTGQPENISAAGINRDSPDPHTARKRRRTETSAVTSHKHKTPSVEKFLAEADHTLSTLLPLENDSGSLPPPPLAQHSTATATLPAPSSSATPFVPTAIDSTIPQTPFTQSYKNLLTEFLASSETSPSVVETKEFHDLVNFLNPETPKFNFNILFDEVFIRQREIRTDKREKPDGSVRTKKFEDSLKKEKEKRRKKEEGYRAWLFRD